MEAKDPYCSESQSAKTQQLVASGDKHAAVFSAVNWPNYFIRLWTAKEPSFPFKKLVIGCDLEGFHVFDGADGTLVRINVIPVGRADIFLD